MDDKIKISTEYIQLGQFLKLANIVESGGMVKIFLAEYEVYVNDTLEDRRGRKLYPGDVVAIPGMGSFEVVKES
ncbi:S4 domain-containing protein YaaA [Thalassobacillus devorans]|uniref:S4 domain-containing protein YaaA n=1 Tax=Thalassobacillus devorans TaxID=279813 RepID=UPI00048E4B70|nr:S4 domain-containing protein YaaA [Thalassobacillus devorans]